MVYEGPDARLAPGLVDQLAQSLSVDRGEPMHDAAMAHLHLVMIHPFRDGNGRMARALQRLIMARDQVLERTFTSIEEWLGRNADDYWAGDRTCASVSRAARVRGAPPAVRQRR